MIICGTWIYVDNHKIKKNKTLKYKVSPNFNGRNKKDRALFIFSKISNGRNKRFELSSWGSDSSLGYVLWGDRFIFA